MAENFDECLNFCLHFIIVCIMYILFVVLAYLQVYFDYLGLLTLFHFKVAEFVFGLCSCVLQFVSRHSATLLDCWMDN